MVVIRLLQPVHKAGGIVLIPSCRPVERLHLSACLYEGVLGLGYGAVLYLYGLAALRGRKSEIAALSLAWVLIAASSAYVMFGVLGILTGEGLGNLLSSVGIARMYSALATTVLKFSMGRFVIALLGRKRSKATRLEDGMMGGVCILVFFL